MTDNSKKERIILVTNDDGITAPGIAMLVESVRHLGRLVVVAPDSPQSGMGHAVTISRPLRLDPITMFEGVECYTSSGTPADCVKLAVSIVLQGKPDLVVSGINHGANSSINVLYSGTMSAAVEAAIEGIPAIGFSLLDYSHEADMSAAGVVAARLSEQLLKRPLPAHSLLNVNIPALPLADLQGIRVCRQARAKWVEEFDVRTDPHGRKYYWMTGRFAVDEHDEDTDEVALAEGYVSVVPVQYDLTDYASLSQLNIWENEVNF